VAKRTRLPRQECACRGGIPKGITRKEFLEIFQWRFKPDVVEK
jgi:hypothetical protein